MTTVGIDTLRLVFPIVKCLREPTVENLDRGRGQHWSKWHLDRGGSLGVANGCAWVEASLPHRVHGDNNSALPFPDVAAALADLLGEAGEYVVFNPAAVSPRLLRVPRVHIVRDFDHIGNPSLLLAGLGRGRQPGRTTVLRTSFAGVTESVTVGTKTSWSAEMYDKLRESGGFAPAGRVRFEARLKTRRLQGGWADAHGGCVRVVADLTEEKMTMLAKGTFDLVGFGEAAATRDEVVRRVEASGLKSQEKTNLLGHLLYQSVGMSSPLSEVTATKYERLARELGVRLHPDALLSSTRLDWDTGREVCEVG